MGVRRSAPVCRARSVSGLWWCALGNDPTAEGGEEVKAPPKCGWCRRVARREIWEGEGLVMRACVRCAAIVALMELARGNDGLVFVDLLEGKKGIDHV